MTPPSDGPTGFLPTPDGVRVNDNPYTLVDVTGPTEAAVMRHAAEWLESFDGAVVVNGATWKGDQTPEAGESVYLLELTVDMSIAAEENRWPRDWFTLPR